MAQVPNSVHTQNMLYLNSSYMNTWNLFSINSVLACTELLRSMSNLGEREYLNYENLLYYYIGYSVTLKKKRVLTINLRQNPPYGLPSAYTGYGYYFRRLYHAFVY